MLGTVKQTKDKKKADVAKDRARDEMEGKAEIEREEEEEWDGEGYAALRLLLHALGGLQVGHKSPRAWSFLSD